MTTRRYLAAVALAGLLAACGGDDDGGGDANAPPSPTATATAGTPAEPVVDMTDALAFEPKEITVKVGDRVQWRNVGQIAHTVTTTPSKVANPDRVSVPRGAKPWDSGLIGDEETFSRTFDEPGAYEYLCIPHEGAGMVGTVVVEG
jgi:plastocyanin